MMMAAFIPGVLILTIMLLPLRMRKRGSFLNLLTLIHAAIDFGLAAFALSVLQLPQLFVSSGYIFIDHQGLYSILITTGIFLMAAFYARGYLRSLLLAREISRESLNLFYIVLNALLISVVLAFSSNNLALFWIFLELTTALSAILIVTLNAKENIMAALKYVFTASSAMLFSFLGLLLVFAMTKQAFGAGTLNWTELMSQASLLPSPLFTVAFVLMFIGFAAKAGIVPFHTWLPPAHAKAPSVVSAILSAALLNAGIYGIIRAFAIAHESNAAATITPILIVFGVLTLAVAAFSMLPRENIKKLIAFSSIEHMGIIVIGIGLGTRQAIFGTLLYMLGHSLIKSMLFFSAGILHRQYESNKYYDMHNVIKLQPLASFGLIIGGIAVIGTPLFPLFLAKIFILQELGAYSLPLLFVALALVCLVAAAFAVFLVRAFASTKEYNAEKVSVFRPPLSMKMPIVILIAAIIFFGVFVPPGLTSFLNNIISSLGY